MVTEVRQISNEIVRTATGGWRTAEELYLTHGKGTVSCYHKAYWDIDQAWSRLCGNIR